MKTKKKFPKIMSALLAVVMMISALPMSAFAAAASDLPANMTDHSILRALEYTGYDVQQQIKDGTLYQSGSYGSRTPSSVLSNISYGTSCSGKETVSDSSTATGKAPNIAKFEQSGLCCAGFVTYYICNYLPNIEGTDTQFITDAVNATGMNSQAVVTWQTALNNLANAGKVEKIGTSSSNVDRSKLTPGDLIIFGNSENSHVHIAVYSGTYNGVDFIIHVGNDRGPEISRVDWMGQAGDKSSYPNAYYHLPQEIFESDGEIEVYKKDTDGKSLAGAVFVATNTESGKSYKIGPTNSNGYAKTENPVPYGTYTVKETVFPTNYHSYGKTEWTVTVGKDNNGIATINAVNEVDNGSAKIVKTSEDGKVEGVTFTVTGNGVNKTVTTNSKGEVQIDNLKPGTYKVTETVADKYEPQETRNVVVVSNQVATVTFNNVLKRGDLEVIKTSEDNLVEGVKFHLYGTSLSGHTVDEYAVTDKNGKATFKDVLISGHETYTLEEVDTAERYIVPESQRTAVEWNKVTKKSFYNELKRGDLTVKKTSEDGFNEGMKFHLYGTSFSGIAVDEYATTDSNGIAYFNDILIGTDYTIEEANTPIRYVIPNKQSADIAWNELTETEFENILKKWRADVFKLDTELAKNNKVSEELMPMALSETVTETVNALGSPYGESQGNATLKGAVYGVYKSETLVDTYTTDENGYFVTDYYVCGADWSIREITPSEGYLLDTTVFHIDCSAENYTVELNTEYPDVYEQVIKGNIAIIKHTDDGSTKIETPENGAKFEVYLKSAGSYENAKETERDMIVCDENGFGQTKQMPYGVYTVHQVSGWDGRELMPDFDVYIAQDGATYRYLINNANFESYVRVVKVDAETNKTIPYAGAAFQIYKPDGELVTMSYTYPTPTTIDTFYTDADGSLVTPEKLPYGKGYFLVEVEAPYGYVLDTTPVYFDVTADNSTTEESVVTVIKVSKGNTAQKGTITVEKNGEVFWGVDVSGDEDSVIYQPIYKDTALAGAVFEIRAAEDIITPDGTTRYTKGELVDTVTTDKDGLEKTKELYLGKYEVKEITAPNGYVLSGETHSVELVYAGQNVAVTETATSFYNERQKATLSITKVLETNDLFGIGNKDEIKNVVFGLYAAEELVSASGTSIPVDGLIEVITFDENGLATVKTDLPIGSYYVKEIATDEHYILNSDKYEFTFEYQGQEIVAVALSVNGGKPIENDLICGSVSGKKVDENGNVLGGAVVGLFKKDETEFTRDNALMTTTSTEDGSFSFANVPYGEWKVCEIEQPVGYILCDTVFDVVISENGQVIEFEIVNEFVRGNITLTKVDADYPENKLSGATFEVYRDNNADGKLDDGDELIGTLTESEIGIYEMKDLLYGHYLVKETVAPEGFLLDSGVYSVFIETDGETYAIENKAGVGFINEAMRGTLKIVKTSSDGKVEGFSFRVTGANGYDEIFVTDENGEIIIEGLRIGEYTVSEVANDVSAAYSRPADKTANVLTDSTTIVEMHNVLMDNPKTGDDSNIALWLGLLGLSALGIGATVFIGLKRRKKDGEQ